MHSVIPTGQGLRVGRGVGEKRKEKRKELRCLLISILRIIEIHAAQVIPD